jgi:hypothetical protein
VGNKACWKHLQSNDLTNVLIKVYVWVVVVTMQQLKGDSTQSQELLDEIFKLCWHGIKKRTTETIVLIDFPLMNVLHPDDEYDTAYPDVKT